MKIQQGCREKAKNDSLKRKKMSVLYLRPRMRSNHLLIFLFCIAFSFSILSAHAKSHTEDAKAILDKAAAVMDLRVPGAKPFQMAAGFHLSGDKSDDELPKDGMYTEIWNSSEHWRTEFDLPGFQQIEVGNGNKRWLTQNLYLEDGQTYAARKLFAFGKYEMGKINKVSSEVVGGKPAQCIISKMEEKELMFCFDDQDHVLLQTKEKSFYYELVCSFTNYQNFGDKMYPQNIRCGSKGDTNFEATITKLQDDATPTNSQLFSPPAGSTEWPVCAMIEHPSPISAPNPDYAGTASALLDVIVGIDGRPINIKVKRSGGDSFDGVAINTVSRWRFRPATCAGVPVPMLVKVKMETQMHN